MWLTESENISNNAAKDLFDGIETDLNEKYDKIRKNYWFTHTEWLAQ